MSEDAGLARCFLKSISALPGEKTQMNSLVKTSQECRAGAQPHDPPVAPAARSLRGARGQAQANQMPCSLCPPGMRSGQESCV